MLPSMEKILVPVSYTHLDVYKRQVVLCVTGIGIGINGLNVILQGTAGEKEVPGMIALIAAVASIGVKEWMFWYTRAAAKKTNSGALMADAWHHRSDALSSIGAFIGILGARIDVYKRQLYGSTR